MTRLFSPPTFVDFGPCALQTESVSPKLERVHGSRTAVLKTGIRERCPRQPGVYGMIDPHGELVYVGKAKNLRARLMTYFRPKSRDPKAGHIVAQAQSIVWEAGPDEFAALHRELELIRRWRPRLNVQGQPRSWQYYYVCLGRAPAPYAFLARRPPKSMLAGFGPLQSGRKAREAVRRLNDLFQLRDCSQAQEMVFADRGDLFVTERAAGCLRHELGTCLGPCAGACSQSKYNSQLRAARAFLAGNDLTPLVRLEAAMREAAAQQLFERAAALRDKLAGLSWLNRQLERMRQAKAMGSVVYPLKGHDEVIRWYILHAGRAVAVVPARHQPSVQIGMDKARELAALAETRGGTVRPAEWIAGVLLLAGWFRRYPQERQGLVPMR